MTLLEDSGQMPYAVKTLRHLPLMKGNRVAVITFSGAAGIIISDKLETDSPKYPALAVARALWSESTEVIV